MDPEVQIVQPVRASRTVSEEQTTPTKETDLFIPIPSWVERLLHGCHPRVAVLDIWAEAGIVAPAAAALGIPYIGYAKGLLGAVDLKVDLSLSETPYDCVVSLLTQSRWAMSFCFSAMRAWSFLVAGGTMVLVMRPAVYEHAKRFLPIPLRCFPAPDGKRQIYVWKKPIAKSLGGTRRHASAR